MSLVVKIAKTVVASTLAPFKTIPEPVLLRGIVIPDKIHLHSLLPSQQYFRYFLCWL
jgi:hypothetical protein